MSNLVHVYDQLAKTIAKINSSRIEIIDDLKKFAEILPPNAKLLDLGCGVGFDSRDFKIIRPDLSILGIDSSLEMLNQFKNITNGIPFKKADMLNVKLASESFDAIWMNASLLHIPKNNAPFLIVNIFNWIKKDGYLYLKTKEGIGEKNIPATKYGRSDLSRFFALYTKAELSKHLLNVGFRILEINEIKQRENWVIAIAQKP